MCGKLSKTVGGLDEELRCQGISLTFAEWSLQISISEMGVRKRMVQTIKERFRAIKRIPEEIWVGILGIVVEYVGEEWHVGPSEYDQPSAAFYLAQVCHLWRKHLLNTPRLWTTIVTVDPEENSDGRDRLMSMLVQRAQGWRLNVINNFNISVSPPYWGGWWPLLPDSANMMLSNYNCHIRQWGNFSKKRPADKPWPKPVHLVLQAYTSQRGRSISHAMRKNLREIPELTIINTEIGESDKIVSDSLMRLKIDFNSVAPTSYTKPKTQLRCLLSPSLQSL
jgi:hypothetical protein